jgi:transcriptional antiterminator NusG
MTVDKKEEKWERTEKPQWYVVHTYSGYENKVKVDLEKTIENRKLQDQMLQVVVPLQEVEKFQNGTKKNSQKKLFPGYVLIQMYMTDDTWYVVRNTRGVTGFVGPESKPVALTQAEIDAMFADMEKLIISYSVGEMVEVTAEGPLRGTIAPVESVDEERETLTIRVEMFGETSAEFSFADVTRMSACIRRRGREKLPTLPQSTCSEVQY